MSLCDCAGVFSIEKEGPSRRTGRGGVEAAQRRVRSCGGKMKLGSSYAGKGPGHRGRFGLPFAGNSGSESLANGLGPSSLNWVPGFRSWNGLFCGTVARAQLLLPLLPLLSTCSSAAHPWPAGGAEETVQTTLPASSESSTPLRSQARISSSCRCFPREPRQLAFWHVELVEIGHSFPPRLTRLSGFLGDNSNRLRN